jgi:hypothetical protein
MQQRSEIPDFRVEPAKSAAAGNVPLASAVDLPTGNHSSSIRTLFIRQLGGWIASLFSWYRY